MKNIFTSLFFLILISTVQAQNYHWSGSMGGSSIEWGMNIATDQQGNSYITGTFQDTADFDPGPGVFQMTATGVTDIFLMKLDPLGNFIWARHMGSPGYNNLPWCIRSHDAGYIYITGDFQGTMDFDMGAGVQNISSGGSAAAFVVKLDSSGSLIWALIVSGGYSNTAKTVAIDDQENVYVSGNFHGISDFDPGPSVLSYSSGSGMDVYFLKLDSSGNMVWANHIGGTGSIDCFSIHQNNGFIYATGYLRTQVDFDPGPGVVNLISASDDNCFIVKYDTAGAISWVRRIAGNDTNIGRSVVSDSSGNVYVTGFFNGSADFNPDTSTFSLASNGLSDVFTMKLDPSGNFNWAFTYGGSQNDYGNCLITKNNLLYLLGSFQDAMDIDPSSNTTQLISSGQGDGFLAVYDATSSALQWHKKIGGTGYELARNGALDASNNFFVTGNFTDTMDANFPLNALHVSSGQDDAFVIKYGPGMVSLPETSDQIPFLVYPNPGQNQFYIDFKEKHVTGKITVYDCLGRIVSENLLQDSHQFILDIHSDQGIYTVELNCNGKLSRTRLINLSGD